MKQVLQKYSIIPPDKNNQINLEDQKNNQTVYAPNVGSMFDSGSHRKHSGRDYLDSIAYMSQTFNGQ